MQRLFVRLAGGRRGRLRNRQREGARARIVLAPHREPGRAGLAIPAAELRQVPAGCGLHGGDEVLAGHRLAVVALEVELHAALEGRLADQRVQHADHLGAFFIHGCRVEVVDLEVTVRPHRVSERPGILQELAGAQTAHVGNSLDRARMQVGGELLVAEYREAFFQRELEPVATGHPVAGPIVKILMGDHALDPEIVAVGGGLGLGQDELGIEDVEALVLHGAEVEIGYRDDHEAIQIVLQAEALLVPAHRLLERGHGVRAFVDLTRLAVDLERHLPARARGEGVLEPGEAAGDQGEQIARLLERVFPEREVAAPGQAAALDQVAVGEQHGIRRLVRLDADAIPGHDVRPVGEIGDLAQALRLALGAEHAVRDVQALERRVRLGMDAHRAFEGERGGQVVHDQAIVVDLITVAAQRLAIEPEPDQLQLLAVQDQGRSALAGRRIAPHHQPRLDHGVRRLQTKLQLDLIEQVVRRPVVRQADGLRLLRFRLGLGHHGIPRMCSPAPVQHVTRRRCELPARAGSRPDRHVPRRPRSLPRRGPDVHHGGGGCSQCPSACAGTANLLSGKG